MGSSRLPGKVLLDVCGRSVLAHGVARVRMATRPDQIVIATTTEPADAAIVAEAEKLGLAWYRGSETDVLARYYEAARQQGATTIVRMTSDCPLYDGALLDRMLADYAAQPCDYLSNCFPRHYPRGLDTEIFSFAALERAYREAEAPHEREHVTPYIHQHPERFRLRNFSDNAPDRSALRWTLDTPEDWALIRTIYEALYPQNPQFTTDDIYALLARHPEISALNAHIEQKKMTA